MGIKKKNKWYRDEIIGGRGRDMRGQEADCLDSPFIFLLNSHQLQLFWPAAHKKSSNADAKERWSKKSGFS